MEFSDGRSCQDDTPPTLHVLPSPATSPDGMLLSMSGTRTMRKLIADIEGTVPNPS